MKAQLFMIGFISLSAFAASNPADFHRAVYALHEQQIAQHKIRAVEEQGDYEGAAAARYRYVDTHYYDAASGLLLSHVRRDADTPEHVHIVEVNVYEHGKLVRDFGSLTLPWAPLQPTRTFINLHQYNGKLHSFRQYDFYGDVGYESCEGELAGKRVRIALDDKDLLDATNTATPEYKACFDGMSADWESYRTPH
jgi:hypothetical protein